MDKIDITSIELISTAKYNSFVGTYDGNEFEVSVEIREDANTQSKTYIGTFCGWTTGEVPLTNAVGLFNIEKKIEQYVEEWAKNEEERIHNG